MMQDAKLMANELMRKAVNYTLNQWKSLKISLRTVLRKSRTTSVSKDETCKATAQELYEHRQ